LDKTIYKAVGQVSRVIYYTDEPTGLNSSIFEDFERIDMVDFSWIRFMESIIEGEKIGKRYIVSIADMFYETLES
jgi:hypothetical protein